MNLKILTDKLKSRMQGRLEKVDLFQIDVKGIGATLSFLRNLVDELDQLISKHKFEDTREEVFFFKHLKPEFLSKVYFYQSVFQLKLYDSFRTYQRRLNGYLRIMRRLEQFAVMHSDLYDYYFSDSTEKDIQYFSGNDNRPHQNCEWVATIHSHELLKDFIGRLIVSSTNTHNENAGKLHWTGPKVDLVELMYALHASDVFNKGAVDIKVIATVFESMFDVRLGNYYRAFVEIQQRKKGQTNFIDSMKTRLLDRFQEK